MATQIYAPPTINDSKGIYEFFNYVNNTSVGLFFSSLMFVIWIVIFVATKDYSSSRAWTYASFVCTVLSIILAVVNLLTPKIMYLFIFATAAGALWMKLEAQG